MQFEVITALFTLSLAAASALPYDHEWPYGNYWDQLSSGRVAHTQATQACVVVTHGNDHSVRICTADKEG